MTKKQYDFSAFRSHKIEPLAMQISSNWQTPMELKATQIFESLNKKELLDYIYTTICDAFQTYETDAIKKYNNRKRYINKMHSKSSTRTFALNQFEVQIIKNYYRSISVFKDRTPLGKTDTCYELLAKKELGKIENSLSSIDKLLYITDYIKSTKKYLEIIALYNHISPKPLTLKSFFKNPDDYNTLITSLISEGRIFKEELNGELGKIEVYYIHRESRPEEQNEWRQICAFGYLLMKKTFLKNKSKPKITSALNNFFGVDFTRQSLEENFERFENLANPEEDEDLDYFKSIKHLK